MPHKILYNLETNIAEVKLTENVTLEELEETYAMCAQLTKEKGQLLILFDLREATLRLSTMEIYELPNLITDIYAREGVSTARIKRANVILQTDHEDGRFFENVAVNRGHRTKFFHDIDEAREWLMRK